MAEPGQAQTSSLGKARTPSLVERIMARGNVVRVNGGQKTERPVSSNYSPPAPASTVGSAGSPTAPPAPGLPQPLAP